MKQIIFSLVLISILAPLSSVSAFSNDAFLSQIEEIENKISLLQAKLTILNNYANSASVIDAVNESNFSVIVDNETIYTDVINSLPTANKTCEALAFKPQYMWKTVSCAFDKQVIYQGVFIAG